MGLVRRSALKNTALRNTALRNTALKHAALVVPGTLSSLTGGYIYDRHVAEGLRDRGWEVRVVELSDTFPHPTPAALAHARTEIAALPSGMVALVDGLAYGAMPEVIGVHAERLRFVPIVHLPLALDFGLDAKVATRLEAEERLALRSARLVIVTGSSTRDTVLQYGVRRSSVLLAEPGTDPAPVARGSNGDRLDLLCVATLTPGKGHATLMRALAAVPHRQWHLTCVGSLTRHPQTLADIRRILGEHDLLDHVSLAGELHDNELAHCFEIADLFVLPTLRETYGMAVAEALAHGLPVVSTTTGAIPKLVGRDAGLLVAPDDEAAFSDALTRVLTDAALRDRLAAGARHVREHLRPWRGTIDKIASALDGLDR